MLASDPAIDPSTTHSWASSTPEGHTRHYTRYNLLDSTSSTLCLDAALQSIPLILQQPPSQQRGQQHEQQQHEDSQRGQQHSHSPIIQQRPRSHSLIHPHRPGPAIQQQRRFCLSFTSPACVPLKHHLKLHQQEEIIVC